MKTDMCDFAIIGGGPVGSTAATLLAKAGWRRIVFEREKLDRTFLPRFGGEIMAACGFAIKWRMWLFYFFVYVQKFFAFSPRLSLVSKKEEVSVPAETAGVMS